MLNILADIILLILLGLCLYTDIREGKIYNKFIFPAFVAALILALMIEGISGLKISLMGAATGLAVMILPYFLGGMGAGDVKLLMVIGALKGAEFTFQAALATFIVGGVIAAAFITYRRQWKQTLSRLKAFFTVLPAYKNGNYGAAAIDGDYSFPYGIAITAGTLIVFLMG
ncbi:MAG: prepilin peptidase CpaA [Clostridia bacterium]|jgi:prepilin peptidase CpaA|nr:peptidase prepilin type [Clostridiales bacterium]MDK2985675.1 prepilin peptidase CpaA [Clostridia bacterium]